jgi:hypothetical protein
MVHFLKTVSHSAEEFLRGLKNEDEIVRKFAKSMRDPLVLFEKEICRKSVFPCLQHGDSWHNNFLFHKTRKELKVHIIDWQVRASRWQHQFTSSGDGRCATKSRYHRTPSPELANCGLVIIGPLSNKLKCFANSFPSPAGSNCPFCVLFVFIYSINDTKKDTKRTI